MQDDLYAMLEKIANDQPGIDNRKKLLQLWDELEENMLNIYTDSPFYRERAFGSKDETYTGQYAEALAKRRLRNMVGRVLQEQYGISCTPKKDGGSICNDERLERIQKRAAGGEAKALYQLGIYYASGTKSTPIDFQRARECFQQAAELHYTPAMLRLGDIYYAGDGVPQSDAEARRWYESAAADDAYAATVRKALALFSNPVQNRAEKEKKPFSSSKNVQLLLLIEALKDTNPQNPKNIPELTKEIERHWKELFPDEPMSALSASSIGRHIRDMNATGLYDIVTSKKMQQGYYNNKFLFTAAEFALIAQALYRTTSISVEETNTILEKLINQTDDVGEAYSQVVDQQMLMKNRAPKRKTSRKTLPIIGLVIRAIAEGRQLAFYYYNRDEKYKKRVELLRDEDEQKAIKFVVSPYFLVWEADECYLICYQEGSRPFLSHFKISLMEENNIRILGQEATSIGQMQEFQRYHLVSTTGIIKQQITKEKGKLSIIRRRVHYKTDFRNDLAQFALDRYMRENPYMIHDEQEVVAVQLCFKEGFLGKVLERFNLNSRKIQANPNGLYTDKGEAMYSAVITVQPNDGFYSWLMAHANQVLVAQPSFIRQEVKKRLQEALTAMVDYENKD